VCVCVCVCVCVREREGGTGGGEGEKREGYQFFFHLAAIRSAGFFQKQIHSENLGGILDMQPPPYTRHCCTTCSPPCLHIHRDTAMNLRLGLSVSQVFMFLLLNVFLFYYSSALLSRPNSFGHSIICTCVCVRAHTHTHPRHAHTHPPGTHAHTRTHLLLGGHDRQAVLLRGLHQRIHLAAQRRGETRENPR